MNFFTVSGIAAQRVSPAASFSTAIFMGLRLTNSGLRSGPTKPMIEADDRAPLQQLGEVRVIARRASRISCVGGLASSRLFFGHYCPFVTAELAASITRRSALPKPRTANRAA